jgi:ATP-binding cassette subfamily B protein
MTFNLMLKHLAEAARQARRQFPYLPRAVRLVWQAAGRLTIVWAVLLVVQGLLPVALVFLTRALVDGVAAALGAGTGWAALLPLWPAGTAMLLVWLASEACQSLGGWIRTAQAEKVQDHIHGLIHDQALRLDLSFYDAPDYYDQLHRARFDALTRPAALIENAGALLQSLVTLVAMGGVLLSFGVWMPLLLVLSTLPALAVVLRHAIRFHRWRKDNTMAIRRASYYDMLLTQREMAAEMRLFGLGPHVQTLFRTLRKRLREEQVNLSRREALAQVGAAALGLASLAAALAWMLLQAARGLASLGGLAMFYQAFYQGQRILRALLGHSGEIFRNLLFLENLFEFLALQPRVREPDQPTPHPAPALSKSVEFQNVSFQYPGMTRPVLENFNLLIPAGRITALVGENGAGKTTLIKLLCRFYDPDAGCVLLDGADLRALAIPSLRRRITVLFQEPVRYHDTVRNNIAFGDFESRPDQARLESAARAAGADAPISRLPDGYDTMLGKWFDGSELSAGEWQRLALARAFLRQADLILLDEPTSSMDSWAEADWLQRFRKLAAGRTALVITHRFTTALHADVIHVMERGRIVESGSHDELLARQGRYAESWTQQMRGNRE